MEWILVLYFAFNTSNSGGVALDHIEFPTEQQCNAAGKKILGQFTSINGSSGVYTADNLFKTYDNRKYVCIRRELPEHKVKTENDHK
jgi:hypothetical protein